MRNALRRISVILLAFMVLGFAAAPSWVAKGSSLKYSVGSDSVTFNVVDVTAEDIKIDVTPSATNKMSRATENRSADSGQFWYDSALLSSASTGSTVGDFTVKGTGTEMFAGKQWNTITLEDTVSGAKTTKVYDKDSGLLLKQSVDKAGVPVITLVLYNIPGLGTGSGAAPATTPPAQQGQQNASATGPSTGAGTQQNASAGTQEQQPDEAGTAGTGAHEGEGQQPASSAPAEEEKGKCASEAILLALLGAAFFLKR